METINNFALTLWARLCCREQGQGALEYIAIVVGLILLVAAGFAIAGQNIFDEASNFVGKVISGATG